MNLRVTKVKLRELRLPKSTQLVQDLNPGLCTQCLRAKLLNDVRCKLKEVWMDLSLELLERVWSYGHPHFSLLAPRTVREGIIIVLSHPLGGNFFMAA